MTGAGMSVTRVGLTTSKECETTWVNLINDGGQKFGEPFSMGECAESLPSPLGTCQCVAIGGFAGAFNDDTGLPQ